MNRLNVKFTNDGRGKLWTKPNSESSRRWGVFDSYLPYLEKFFCKIRGNGLDQAWLIRALLSKAGSHDEEETHSNKSTISRLPRGNLLFKVNNVDLSARAFSTYSWGLWFAVFDPASAAPFLLVYKLVSLFLLLVEQSVGAGRKIQIHETIGISILWRSLRVLLRLGALLCSRLMNLFTLSSLLVSSWPLLCWNSPNRQVDDDMISINSFWTLRSGGVYFFQTVIYMRRNCSHGTAFTARRSKNYSRPTAWSGFGWAAMSRMMEFFSCLSWLERAAGCSPTSLPVSASGCQYGIVYSKKMSM